MNGVTSWDVPEDAVPCELLLIGEASFPVMVNDMGQVLIAASSYGRGRLVVVSHEDYLVEAQLTPFLLNAVGWLCSSPGAPVGVHPSLAPLAHLFSEDVSLRGFDPSFDGWDSFVLLEFYNQHVLSPCCLEGSLQVSETLPFP